MGIDAVIHPNVKAALSILNIVAFDGTDPSTTMYFQIADGTIYKWASNIRYIADIGTMWANRITANYTSQST